jgi:hypothetical protein
MDHDIGKQSWCVFYMLICRHMYSLYISLSVEGRTLEILRGAAPANVRDSTRQFLHDVKSGRQTQVKMTTC